MDFWNKKRIRIFLIVFGLIFISTSSVFITQAVSISSYREKNCNETLYLDTWMCNKNTKTSTIFLFKIYYTHFIATELSFLQINFETNLDYADWHYKYWSNEVIIPLTSKINKEYLEVYITKEGKNTVLNVLLNYTSFSGKTDITYFSYGSVYYKTTSYIEGIFWNHIIESELYTPRILIIWEE